MLAIENLRVVYANGYEALKSVSLSVEDGEIVALIEDNPELIDARVLDLAQRDEESGSDLTRSLRAYLDHFGDVRAAATALHVHPNTLRYRIRRIQELTGMDLDDPATRLVVALTLRVPRTPPAG